MMSKYQQAGVSQCVPCKVHIQLRLVGQDRLRPRLYTGHRASVLAARGLAGAQTRRLQLADVLDELPVAPDKHAVGKVGLRV